MKAVTHFLKLTLTLALLFFANYTAMSQSLIISEVSGHTKEDGTTAIFTVALSSPNDLTRVEVFITSSNQSEVSVQTETLRFQRGETAPQTVMLLGEDDSIIDGNQEVTITISSSSGDTQTIIVINDDDDQSLLTASVSNNAREDNENGSFIIHTSVPSTTDTDIQFTLGGTATQGEDYTSLTSVILPANSTEVAFNILVSPDNITESNETVELTIAGSSNANIIPDDNNSATLTIIDNDDASINIEATTNANEAGISGVFTISSSNLIDQDIEILALTSGTAVAGTDYTEFSSPIVFPANTTSLSVEISPIADNTVEPDKTIDLAIGYGGDLNINFGTNEASISLIDDDTSSLSIEATNQAGEDETDGAFNLTASNPISYDYSIQISIEGTATANTDYTYINSPLTLPANTTSLSIPVEIIADEYVEGDETANITLLSDSNNPDITIGNNNSASITIMDNDIADLTINTENITVEEGRSGSFNVSLAARPQSDVNLSISSDDENSATVSPSALTFNSNNWNTAQQITATGVQDENFDDETVNIEISVDNSNSDINFNDLIKSVSVTIEDDDSGSFIISNTTLDIDEGISGVFTVALSSQPTSTVIINIVSNDTNIASPNPTSITFNNSNWNTEQLIEVTGTEDNNTENETTILTLNVDPSSDANFVAAPNQTITINVLDDDTPPVFTSTPVITTNEDEPYSYAITTEENGSEIATLTVIQIPSWLTFTTSNGSALLSGTPSQEDVNNSPYNIIIRATNTFGYTDQSFTLTVNNVNDAPTFTSTAITTGTEDSPYSYQIQVADEDGDNITISTPELPDWLTFTNISNGQASLTGTPDNNDVGENTINLLASDGETSTNQYFIITVANVNDAPVITSVHITTATEDQLYNYDITTRDDDGDAVTIQSSTLPDWLTFSDNGDGTATLSGTPSDIDVTSTPITLQISDGQITVDYTFQITVSNINDIPVIDNSNYTTRQNTSLSIKITDFAHDDDDLIPDEPNSNLNINSIRIVNNPNNGQVEINATDSIIIYNPNTDFSGNDEFIVTIQDINRTTSNEGVVSITVSNEAPNAVNDNFTIDEDTPTSLNVLSNDEDEQNNINEGSLEIIVEPSYGTATINNNGSIQYSPNLNYNGTDQITYRISDTDGYSDQAIVNITISPVNDAPNSADDNINTLEDTPIEIDVLNNDTDIDNSIDATTLSVIDQVTNGSLNHNTNTHTFIYTPLSNFHGNDTFTYSVEDEDGARSEALVTITVQSVNDAPEAQNDEVETNEDTSIIIWVLDNDTDIENNIDSCNISINQQPTIGNAQTIGCGRIEYTPNFNFKGNDSFTYQVCDSLGACGTATVNITVVDINEAPNTTDDSYTIDEDSSSLLDILVNDNDEENNMNIESLAILSAPSNGTATVEDGQIRYVPEQDYYGSDSFTYKICDSEELCSNATVTIEITSINDAPNAVDDHASTDINAIVSIDVAQNDIDPEDDLNINSITIANQALNGSTVVESGLIIYTPNNDFEGNDILTYSICDNEGLCSEANVYIIVSSNTNTSMTKSDYVDTDEDIAVNIQPLLNDNDPDGIFDLNTLIVALEPTYGTYTLDLATSSIEYIPDENYNGSDMFSYQICDNRTPSFCFLDTVYITINPVNDLPVAGEDFMTVMEGRTAELDLTLNDDDVETPESLLVSINWETTHIKGSAKILEDGKTLQYSAIYDCGCTDETIEYLLDDGTGSTSIGTVTIQIEEAPDNMPEVITPNGDGINDYFIIPGIDEGLLTPNELFIFNRWGAQLFHMVNYDNSWDGRSTKSSIGSDELPEGTYFYVFKLEDGRVFKGTFYIKR